MLAPKLGKINQSIQNANQSVKTRFVCSKPEVLILYEIKQHFDNIKMLI
jgi:hypothetical protein